ncbi:hypothetical protein V9T40_011778 [Parthenolecanium corni]|uniref:Uncharacterized protein n=1 Tax=Parthenolecanium corni TaxID=536013 RepID=A0AAN9XYQ7_9HEMI
MAADADAVPSRSLRLRLQFDDAVAVRRKHSAVPYASPSDLLCSALLMARGSPPTPNSPSLRQKTASVRCVGTRHSALMARQVAARPTAGRTASTSSSSSINVHVHVRGGDISSILLLATWREDYTRRRRLP